MENKKAIIFDTETTDASEDKEIIQAAWIAVSIQADEVNGLSTLCPEELDKDVSILDKLYAPSKPISMGAMAIHHIMDEDLVEKDPSHEFSLPQDVSYLIGHNIDFDWEAAGAPSSVKRIDTLAIAKILWPECDSHSLGALTYFLERDTARDKLIKAHSAMVDVKNCAGLVNAILVKVPKIKSLEDLWVFSEFCRIPSIMTFGKHKGEKVEDVPESYKKFLLDKDDLDPYLRVSLNGEGSSESSPFLEGVIIGRDSPARNKL